MPLVARSRSTARSCSSAQWRARAPRRGRSTPPGAVADRRWEAIDAIEGCRVVGKALVGRPGGAAHDPLRIVIDVRGTGCTGYEVSQALQRGSDVYVELATHATIVLVLGLGQPVGALERFAHDLAAELDEIRRPGRAATLAPPDT